MNPPLLDRLRRQVATKLHEGHMRRLGIGNTMRIALACNRLKNRRQEAQRRALYEKEFAPLLEENGPPTRPGIVMKDGWALDTSLSLPHLERVLEDSEKIIAERAGVRRSAEGAYRSYFQDMWKPEDLVKYPSFIDFATSSDLLATVAAHLKCLPALSTTLPSGFRLVESNALYDDKPGNPHDSQLYHMDYYSLPNVYVLVLLQDTTRENGPWTFLPLSVSQTAAAKLGNWKRGHGYRFSDEEIYAVAKREDVIEFCHPRGTVLFIESSGCFHYGSRNSVKPRYQLMLGYTGACRTDLTEAFMKPRVYPIREGDSRLRKWVLDKGRLE